MRKVRFYQVITIFFAAILLVSPLMGNNPQKEWKQYKSPEDAGFSSEKLAEAKKIYDQMGAAAYMVIYKGHVLVSWGDVQRRFVCHSMRKSLLSAMYGIHVDKGKINLDTTLEKLKIKDQTPLNEEEKQATIRDLLKARSGVYLPAAAETPGMKARRPKRGSHKHDTFWYYNNWDFNVLGTIYRQETGEDVFESFKKYFGDPLGMQDFRVKDGFYFYQREFSDHPAYHFKLSARDGARFGQLFLNKGKWNGKQILSEKYIKESTYPYSDAGAFADYGYLWWLLKDFKDLGAYAALGVGTQVIAVFPGADLVIVQRVNTYRRGGVPPKRELIEAILDAKVGEPKEKPELMALQNTPSFKRPPLIKMSEKELHKFAKEYGVADNITTIKMINGKLVVETGSGSQFLLFPFGKDRFVIEDVEEFLYFEMDEKGVPYNVSRHPTIAGLEKYENILKIGVDKFIADIKANKKEVSESDINLMGYQLLGGRKIDDGIKIFKLNVKLHPKSFNVYDSLGDAYQIKGDKEQAIVNFKKALELNPKNALTKRKLAELEKK